MAQHRVGGSYLSDAELARHHENQWVNLLVIVGLVVFGFAAKELIIPLLPYSSPKWLKIIIIVISAVLGAGLLVYLKNFIKYTLGLAILGAIGFGVYEFLYKIV